MRNQNGLNKLLVSSVKTVIFIENLRNLAQLIKVERFSFSREGGNKMPNYVRNILQINAQPEKTEEVFKTIRIDTDPDRLFDLI